MGRIERHSEILAFLHDVYVRKNNDYGNSATDTFREFGMTAYAVRLSDKLSRFKQFAKNQGKKQLVPDESVVDTLLDLANYAIMAVIDIEGEGQNTTDGTVHNA